MKKIWLALMACVAISTAATAQKCISGNCQNGQGTVIYPTGAKYEGEFRGGVIAGTGTLYFTNGNVYSGNWVNQMRDGRGKMTFKNGNLFEGNFSKNKMTGAGMMKYANGDKYVGQWLNDQMAGAGKYVFASGERYEGNFEGGQFEGVGTMFYPDGAKYVGNWKANRKNGPGKYVYANGSVTNGTWVNGELDESDDDNSATAQTTTSASQKPTSKPTTKPSNQPNLKGLKDCGSVNCGNGRGYYRYTDGSIFVGDFKEGYPEGKGSCYYANGDRYEGGWAKNAPHGEGVMYFSSGRVYGAVWLYGSPVRELDSQEDVPTNEQVDVEASKNVKIWAVVVGVARYEHMPTLRFPDDDAYQVYAFLKSPSGGALPDNQIKVLIDEDATRENILRAMRSQFLKADENDVVMLYYSGHGLEGAFLPSDYDGYQNKLRHDEVKEIFNESHAKHKLCIADACHSGSLLAARSPVVVTLDKYYKAFEDSDGGTALLMSSKSEEVSLEDNGLRQGVFSHFLLKGMKGAADANRDGIVTITELYDFVYRKVREYTGNAQSPILTGSFDKNMPCAVVRS